MHVVVSMVVLALDGYRADQWQDGVVLVVDLGVFEFRDGLIGIIVFSLLLGLYTQLI